MKDILKSSQIDYKPVVMNDIKMKCGKVLYYFATKQSIAGITAVFQYLAAWR